MLGSDTGTYARFGAFCSGLQDFDNAHFMLPASEALAIDPHTRQLLHLSQVACDSGCFLITQCCKRLAATPDSALVSTNFQC